MALCVSGRGEVLAAQQNWPDHTHTVTSVVTRRTVVMAAMLKFSANSNTLSTTDGIDEESMKRK